MAQSQFSLTWAEHRKNMCNGLSVLQQRGEFVDMTLAADGHYVKVHQVILALASPYIKDLITSAQCPHPVLILNKISYGTLCAILEYIYTGEVYISIGDLAALSEAAKELRIKGLEDMKLPKTDPTMQQSTNEGKGLIMEDEEYSTIETLDEEIYFDIPEKKEDISMYSSTNNCMTDGDNADSNVIIETVEDAFDETYEDQHHQDDEPITSNVTDHTSTAADIRDISENMSVMQYTTSTQGSLQMILNRFMYYLKHSNRDGSRQWRCLDYLTPLRCPAHVTTRHGVVVLRVSAHTHPFHDKKILKKVHSGAVFSALQDAFRSGAQIKISRIQQDNTIQ